MTATSILINVGSQTAGAVRNLNRVTDSLRDQQRESSSWGRSMLKASNLAKAGFAAAGFAAVGAAASLVSFGLEAVEDQKQAENLANSLKTIPGVTQQLIDKNADWIDSMELATNIADTDLRMAMSRLALVTQDVAKAQDLVAIAADVSVGRNISLAAATKLVEKAATGHTEALMKQMPWLDANKDGALSTSEAIEGLGNAYKGAADKAANNDPWKRLKTIWGQLKEALGQFLLPLLKKFGDWFADKKNQQKVQDMINKVADLSYQLGTKAVKAIEDFIKWLKSPDGQRAMKQFADLAEDISDALALIMHWADKLKVVKWSFKLQPWRLLLDQLNRVKSAMEWILNHLPGVNAGRSSGGGDFRTASVSSMSGPTVVTQNVYATFNLTGRPEENVREFDRYLRRAGNRGRVTVTA